MKTIQVVNYGGVEYKVFLSYNGKEIIRIDGLKYEEAEQIADWLEIGRLTILEGAKEVVGMQM